MKCWKTSLQCMVPTSVYCMLYIAMYGSNFCVFHALHYNVSWKENQVFLAIVFPSKYVYAEKFLDGWGTNLSPLFSCFKLIKYYSLSRSGWNSVTSTFMYLWSHLTGILPRFLRQLCEIEETSACGQEKKKKEETLLENYVRPCPVEFLPFRWCRLENAI